MALTLEGLNDPKELGGILVDVEERFKNADYAETLFPFLATLEQTHGQQFRSQQDSSGAAWAPLAASTIARKRHSRILYETGALEASLAGNTGDSVRAVSHRGLLFGTQVEYAGFHQEGTSRMPARPPVGMQVQTLDEMVNAVADAAVEQLKYTF